MIEPIIVKFEDNFLEEWSDLIPDGSYQLLPVLSQENKKDIADSTSFVESKLEDKIEALLSDIAKPEDTPLERALLNLQKTIDDRSDWSVQKIAFLNLKLELTTAAVNNIK
jgi:hypothetical protein